ncbi:MAG: hypothetical protein Q7S21_06150 [archaeon]|nr:hypothetical protein [archaeon]
MPPHEPPRKKPNQSTGRRMELERKGIGGKKTANSNGSVGEYPKEFRKAVEQLRERGKKFPADATRTEVYQALKEIMTIEEIIKIEMAFAEKTHQGKPKANT